MSIESLTKAVRNIPDFPIDGIQFKDITPLFQSPEKSKRKCLKLSIKQIQR